MGQKGEEWHEWEGMGSAREMGKKSTYLRRETGRFVNHDESVRTIQQA
jgi:hypothetical protein